MNIFYELELSFCTRGRIRELDETGHLNDEVCLLPRPDQNSFRFPFTSKFGSLSEVKITKALICTRKQYPEGFWS